MCSIPTCRSCGAAPWCWPACSCCAPPGYGYGLLQDLERLGFATDANTLYPLLRRLEKQGHLTSEWNTEEARPRKFYRTSATGISLADALTSEWTALSAAISSLTPGSPTLATEEN